MSLSNVAQYTTEVKDKVNQDTCNYTYIFIHHKLCNTGICMKNVKYSHGRTELYTQVVNYLYKQ